MLDATSLRVTESSSLIIQVNTGEGKQSSFLFYVLVLKKMVIHLSLESDEYSPLIPSIYSLL